MSACTKNPEADGPIADGAALRPKIRDSKAGRWRALVLILVHLALAAHIWHWSTTGSTLSPLEPSESMEFSARGIVNAGLIFFALTIVSTLILGRWFCGWACHVVALQDFCRWLLMKVGLRPRLVDLGILRAVPWLAFTYMFLMPLVHRFLVGAAAPDVKVHLYTQDFWRTFPSWPVALATFLVCGFVIIYFLGAKGFCNYGCPYGAIYGVADQLAPMRIRVTDACEGCGHCTAVCSSNVKVHQEVRDWKMVVDPACMKCLDCVSVCPKDALYVGFGAPAITAAPRSKKPATSKRTSPQTTAGALARWLVTALFTLGTFTALSAFNGEVAAYVNPPDWRLIGTLTAFSLIVMFVFRGKAPSKSEYTLAEQVLLGCAFLAALLAFRGLYGSVPLLFALGLAVLFAWALVQALRLFVRADVKMQRTALKHAGSWRTPGLVFAAIMVLVLSGFVFAAREQLEVRRTGMVEFARRLFDAGVANARVGATEDALKAFQRALEFDPEYLEARENLAGMLCQSGRLAEGVEQFEIALAQNPGDADTHALTAQALLALRESERAQSLQPALPEAKRGQLLQRAQRQAERAVEHLREAVRLAPARAELRGALAEVLTFLGRSDEAARVRSGH